MWSTPSLPLLPDPFLAGVVVLIKVPTMGEIELFNHLTVSKQITDIKLLVFHSNTWNHLPVCIRMSNIE